VNEFHSTCFFILIVAAIVVVLLISRGNSLSPHELQSVAERWNGRIDRAGLFAFDEVIFWIGEAPARLHFTRRGKHERNTHVSIHFPDDQLRLELYSAGVLRKLLGVEDIEIGSASFDESFIISGNRPERIRETLTDAAQAAIVAVAELDGVFLPDLHLSISGGVLRVTKHGSANDNGGLMQLLTYFEAMYHALTVNCQPSIQFVAAECPPPAQSTQCQVCGDALVGPVVTCARCQTPHHLDCWQYFGSCSVYGCGETRYLDSRDRLLKSR
jgi:hypothetical protein